MKVSTRADGTAPGYVFVAPKNGPEEATPAQDGCLIFDDLGEPVWFRPLQSEDMDVMNFKRQRFRGRPVLTWWEGVHTGHGQGEFVIMDNFYREVARVGAGSDYEADHHEFLITPEDTALLDIYNKVPVDLSERGGRKDQKVLDGIVQEVDIETGEVLFEWHSLDHVGLEESYLKPYDYFHINSVELDLDGNLLVSSRSTSTVYKIDRKSGEVIWRLGGKGSDFRIGEGARFAFQHDARRRGDGAITLFDNRGESMGEPSRAVALDLDERAMTATLAREYVHPTQTFAIYQGNVQTLANGNAFVGWGSAPVISEFSPEGELLFDARFPEESESYRAFRQPWEGYPEDHPAVAAERGPEDRTTLYVSWNGATEVAAWEILAGRAPARLEPLAKAPRKGFETAITFATSEPYVAARAIDRSGRTLGTSEAVGPKG